ncbi:hypothetical protein [Ideonella sp.]|uniref:hypothetical protein n=1 Tax=Ideonella sp. TaxID=1929293 RepID=UPI003BB59A6A
MISTSWNQECEAYSQLSTRDREIWLVQLASALTIAARDTYQVGGDDLSDSKRMRRFNELLHRVVNQLRNELQGESGFPDEALLAMVKGETAALTLEFSALKALM